MAKRTTWKPATKHGKLTKRSDLADSVFAFPREREEPLTDARHVRNALARFDQVEGVTDAERDQAFANIRKAAKYYGVNISEKSWHDLGKTTRPGVSKKAKTKSKTPRKKAKRAASTAK